MTPQAIKAILFSRINPGLLELAEEEAGLAGIPKDAGFTQSLFMAMTQLNPALLILSPWQLSGLASGLLHYKAPIDWEQTDNVGNSPIHYVLWSGKLEALDKALKDTEGTKQLDKMNDAQMGAVHFAAWSGNPAMLEKVLPTDAKARQAALSQKDSEGRTALQYAAWSGNPAMLSMLLPEDAKARKAALSQKDSEGRTLVHYAAWSGETAILDLLVPPVMLWEMSSADKKARKAALSQKDNGGRTAVHYAAWSGTPVMLDSVLAEPGKAGTDLEKAYQAHLSQEDNKGHRAIHFVARSGNSAMLAEMLAKDSDAYIRRDKNGWNIVHYTALSGNPVALDRVLSVRAAQSMSLNPINYGNDALGLIAAWSGNLAMLESVLAKNPDALAEREGRGRTAASYAAHSDNPAMLVWMLMEHHDLAKQEVKDLVFMAAKSGNAELLNNELLQKKSDKFPTKHNSRLLERGKIRPVYETVLKALKTNFVLTQVDFHAFPRSLGEVPAEIKEQIEYCLARNRELWELINAGINYFTPKSPLELVHASPTELAMRAFVAVIVSGKDKAKIHEYYENVKKQSNELKERAYSLRAEQEQADFFQDHIKLTQSIWAVQIMVQTELMDSPIAILKKFNERAPQNTNPKLFAKNVEKNLFGKALKDFEGEHPDWATVRACLIKHITDDKIKPSFYLQQLLSYLEYRTVVGGLVQGQVPTIAAIGINDAHDMDAGASGPP